MWCFYSWTTWSIFCTTCCIYVHRIHTPFPIAIHCTPFHQAHYLLVQYPTPHLVHFRVAHLTLVHHRTHHTLAYHLTHHKLAHHFALHTLAHHHITHRTQICNHHTHLNCLHATQIHLHSHHTLTHLWQLSPQDKTCNKNYFVYKKLTFIGPTIDNIFSINFEVRIYIL